MADPAKANSQQPPRRKKTAARGKKRGARTNQPSARRQQSKSSQIDLFDEEILTSKREEKAKTSPKRIVADAQLAAAKPATEEVAAAKQTPQRQEKVVPQPKAPTPSAPPREAPKELPKEVTNAPSPQNLPRFSRPAADLGPRRLLRSQQQRATKLRRILYIGGGVLLLLMIAFAVFLVVRGRARTNIKGVSQSASSEISPPATGPGDGAPSPPSEETSDAGLGTAQTTTSPLSSDEQQPEQVGELAGVSDSQENLEEQALATELVEAESPPPSTTATTPEILRQVEAVSPSEPESSEKTHAISEQSPSESAPGEAEKASSAKVAESTPAELAMTEKTAPSVPETAPSVPVESPELLPEEWTTAVSKPESSEQISAVDFSSPWTNSLGMKFVPVDDVLFSIWETRVKDFEAFCEATGRGRDRAPFEESGDHPVSRVNWKDTQEFCAWLTEKERSQGIIGSDQYYRLPTDLEWSHAAGLEGETGDTPEARDSAVSKTYPWGSEWPPSKGAGNIADRSASSQLKSTVDSYKDGYVRSAPVGSFSANSLGIFDLSGNLWEWCQDAYGGKGRLRNWRVMRGGGWSTNRREQLLSSYRNVIDPDSRGLLYGFRCVLARE